ncbi:MAG: D-aminoacylase [Planctomycetaceae bacterium]|nr:D-aminoacylase [Planctomycetaceae bacterium]MDG2390183.1 D-aminoacylase [Planctomycetaceae bacterium]
MSELLFDILIRNGTVIDGTGSPRCQADVGLSQDRIAAIGDLSAAKATTIIDATEKIVAPGFIDVHNHTDGWLLKTEQLAAKTMQGITTEVIMADGISYAPVNDQTALEWTFYLRALNALRLDEYRGWRSLGDYLEFADGKNVQNFIPHVPYANVRSLACGFGRQAVDDFQMRQICGEIRDGMEAGAVGLSTGLDYIAQCFSTTDELVRACEAIAPYNGLYVTHMRYKTGIMNGLKEAVEIGRRAGVRVHISHMKGLSQDDIEPILEYIDTVARHEVDFSFDVYPYQPGSTMLNYLLPYEVWEDGPLAAITKMREPVIKAKFAEGLKLYSLDLDHIRIAWVASKENSIHQGKTLAQYIADMDLPPEEALFRLLLEEGLAVLLVFDQGDDRLIEPFLKHDLYMMGSDGIYHDNAHVHPRVFGSTGRLLGPLVRDRKLFSLEETVHKMTGVSATRFGLTDRGVLRENAFADVVVFDAETISDRATYADPQQTCVGIEQVIVNGSVIVKDSRPLVVNGERQPGRALKYSAS